MKIPQFALARKAKDPPLLLLFGASITEDQIDAEWHYVRERVRAGTVLRSGKDRYRLPALTPGLHMQPLTLVRHG